MSSATNNYSNAFEKLVRCAACFAALLLLSACDTAPPPAQAVAPATTLPSGALPQRDMPFQALLTETPFTSRILGDGELLVIEVPPGEYAPELVASPATGISPRQAMQQQALALLIGSGFVMDPRSYEPIGLLQQQGQLLSEVQPHGYTRILGIRDERLEVIHRNEFDPARFSSALQAGPGVVENFALDISERDLQRPKFFRSFVAVCDGMWLAGISLKPTNLHTLGKLVLADIAHRSYRCKDLVNLAGDRQAVLMLRQQDGTLLYHGDPDAAKVTLLGFSAQPPASATP